MISCLFLLQPAALTAHSTILNQMGGARRRELAPQIHKSASNLFDLSAKVTFGVTFGQNPVVLHHGFYFLLACDSARRAVPQYFATSQWCWRASGLGCQYGLFADSNPACTKLHSVWIPKILFHIMIGTTSIWGILLVKKTWERACEQQF